MFKLNQAFKKSLGPTGFYVGKKRNITVPMNAEVAVPTDRSSGMTMAIAQALPSDISLTLMRVPKAI